MATEGSAAMASGPAEGDLPLAAALAGGAVLPPLRLSMHVYAEDPARRFAILDGVRVREGESLEGGLQVLEIRRDGLRLAWNGRVLWVPR
ncbi:general secretion pathway protein GspB [Silanimonas lenta]|jgi:general secretion pathway protein B